jgi:hypothetical protein
MLTLGWAILLMGMRIRNMVQDANALEKKNWAFDIHHPNQFE